MANFKYEVKENIGTISKRGANVIDLRLISWDGKEPQYDIRSWYKDSAGNEKCTKGVTMSRADLVQLLNIVKSIDFT